MTKVGLRLQFGFVVAVTDVLLVCGETQFVEGRNKTELSAVQTHVKRF